MADSQCSLHQIEFKAAHALHLSEFVANQRFLGRAIHVLDAVAHMRQRCIDRIRFRAGHRNGSAAASLGATFAHGNSSFVDLRLMI